MQGKLTPSSKMLENVAGQKVKADEIYEVDKIVTRNGGLNCDPLKKLSCNLKLILKWFAWNI